MSDMGTRGIEDGATLVVDPPRTGGPTTTIVEPQLGGALSINSESLLDALELPVEVRLGRRVVSLERTLALRIGDALPVGPDDEDTVTLFVQGRPYANGDLVVVDGRFAFRVRELVTRLETP